MPNITLRDIANALGLSVSTVSKALRDSYEIGPATKQRVLAYATANHYLPNRMAKSLKEGRTRTIGIVVCSIDNSFVSHMLDGIDSACTKSGYDAVIMQSKESLAQEKVCLKLLEARGVEGILMSPSAETVDLGHVVAVQEAGMPIVLFDRICGQTGFHQVGIDNHQAAFLATEHLILNGYRRIAMLNIGPDIDFALKRGSGYGAALARYGIPLRTSLVRYCRPVANREVFRDGVVAEIGALMTLPEPPEALFTATDQLSTLSLAALRRLGYRIPDDIALIGFSNSELAEILTPPLSAVYQPAFEIGRQAAEKLIGLIGGREEPGESGTIMLPVRLDIRESSAVRFRATV